MNPTIRIKLINHILQNPNLNEFSNLRDLDTDQLIELKKYEDLVSSGYPLDYILGKIDFAGFSYTITPEVLIPREETEYLVTQLQNLLKDRTSVLEELESKELFKDCNLVDLGCGSGVIGLSLATHFKTVILVDDQETSLENTINNIKQLKLENTRVIKSNWLENVNIEEKDWILISNPPYVPTTDKDQKVDNQIQFEPEEAIFAGLDGLDDFRVILKQTQQVPIKLPKLAIFELDPRNIYQAKVIIDDLFAGDSFLLKDQSKIDRFLIKKFDK